MRPIEVLFVDKGGVLIDNNDLSPQWRRLIGEFLAPRLGGSMEAWGAANVPAFERQLERWRAAMAGRGPADIRGFFAKDARLWFLDMCDGVGLVRPPDAEAERIAADTVAYVNAHLEIRAPQRGLRTLRALRERGLTLHVASADSHDELVAFLERIGARDLFDRVYGSDLVNTWKFGPSTTAPCWPTAASIRSSRRSSTTRPQHCRGHASARCVASSWTANTRKTSTTR